MSQPNCEQCPLNQSCGKHSANHYGTAVAVVVDQVDRSGEHSGMLCNGRDADELIAALRKLGMKRNDVSYVPVIRGQYPGMSRKKYKGAWERRYKKTWGKDVPSPEEACRPWFEAQIARYKHVIAIGPNAGSAVLKGSPAFDKTRGTPVFPEESTINANVVMTWAGWMLRSEPKYVPFFRKDLAKAFRFFAGKLEWTNPVLLEVTPDNWRKRLAALKRDVQKRGYVVWDLESKPYAYSINAKGEKTKRYNTLLNPLQVAGMGWRDKAYVANFATYEWPEEDMAAYVRGYSDILEDASVVKIGPNSIGYDELNWLSLFGVQVQNHRDTMIMARLVSPELPKSLAFWAAALTDVAGWKDGADYTNSMYNAIDCAVTDAVFEKMDVLFRKCVQRQAYRKIVPFQRALNRMCRVGVPIRESKRAELEDKYAAMAREKLAALRAVAGEDFNPRSNADIERQLYDTWSLPVPNWTDSGAPACDKDALIELLGSQLLSSEQRQFIDDLRRYKLATTLLSSFLVPWRASGVIVRNGRLFPGMSASGTVGARPSSNNPNLLTTPRVLKEMMLPPEGFVWIETDLSSAEFVYVIKAAGITELQTAFDHGWDIHGTIMKSTVGPLVETIAGYPEGGPESGDKGSGEYANRRQLQKNFNFATLYAAKARQKRDILRKDMNKQWDLMNVDLTLGQTTAMDTMFHRTYPELSEWWDTLAVEYEQNGFIRDDNWGLVRFMPNGYKPTEASNFKAQSSTAAYVNDAILRMIDHPLLTPNPDAGTGLMLTVYDSVHALAREEDAEAACRVMHAEMVVDDPNTGLRINAETTVKYADGSKREFTPEKGLH